MNDTADTHLCLSQNQQLFCSAFVHDHVVFFATGIGPATGSNIYLIGDLQVYYSLLLLSAPLTLTCTTAFPWKRCIGCVTKKSMGQGEPSILNEWRSPVYSMCDLTALTARSLSLVKNLYSIPEN
jgi:hypothetical protein